jgi:metal-responsive CopG/Arc/MetJ family transcriptional regulator
MANVKTAISLRRTLFERADAVAREMGIPRSRLFAIALERFLQRRESRELLERANAAYAEPDAADQAARRRMRRSHRRLVDGEW